VTCVACASAADVSYAQLYTAGALITFFPALTVEQVKQLTDSQGTELQALLEAGHPVSDATIAMAKEQVAAQAAAAGVPWQ
jgi:hypothetical protein